MKLLVKWNDFISEFLYLVVEVSVPEETWKDNLYNKLSLCMQELTMPVYNDDDKTFWEFIDYCSCIVMNIENMERIKACLNSSANT
jgi:Uma2 family endonuclease